MPTRSPLRLALIVALTVCLVLGAIPQAVAATPPRVGGSQMPASPAAEATVVEFKHTGQSQLWQVPAGVTAIRVDVQGAQGGGTYGGLGARVQATLPVQPGQQLQVNVGGRGLGVSGGFNGGGDAGLGGRGVGGGGASDIRVAPYALSDRLVVAGGGGGAAPDATSIFGVGGSAGRDGQAGGDGSEDRHKGGGGGTQAEGGAGGDYAEPGRLGQGGKSGYRAGGGGGGYYGGGGGVGGPTGAVTGGGGAGSSSVTTDADSVRWMEGFRPDDGLIVISYPPDEATPPPPAGDTVRFGFTGGPQLWRVPAGVRSIRVDAIGAQGAGIDETPASYGGFGARVQAIVEVEPEQLLTVLVGGKGDGTTAGFNGGGKLGWAGRGLAGGGASDVRLASWRLEDRLVVAGGGGGAAPAATPVFGVGGSAGRDGQAGGGGSEDRHKGGGGGTQTQGGAAGDTAQAGRLGQGGEAGYNGGGGGGGYYGGGGGGGGTGGVGGGGGAGSSYGTPAATSTTFTRGYGLGHGSVTITYPPEAANPASPGSLAARTFEYTGVQQVYRVPDGVAALQVDAQGAQGGNGGGRGGRTRAILPVSAGQLVPVVVGGQGVGETGGFNGGGSSGLGRGVAGGGASDVRLSGWRLEDRQVVAGGGGGHPTEENSGPGGAGGGLVGWAGGPGDGGRAGGGGGTQTAGGRPGGEYAGEGRLGQGGRGGYWAGAGGGGFYGGGGGFGSTSGSPGGGGGGSGYVSDTALAGRQASGRRAGSGVVTITPLTPAQVPAAVAALQDPDSGPLPIADGAGQWNVVATIDGPDRFRRGRLTRFWVTVHNQGPTAVHGVMGELRLPAGISYQLEPIRQAMCKAALRLLQTRGVQVSQADQDRILRSPNCIDPDEQTTTGPTSLPFRIERLDAGEIRRMPLDIVSPVEGPVELAVGLDTARSRYTWTGDRDDFANDPKVRRTITSRLAEGGAATANVNAADVGSELYDLLQGGVLVGDPGAPWFTMFIDPPHWTTWVGLAVVAVGAFAGSAIVAEAGLALMALGTAIDFAEDIGEFSKAVFQVLGSKDPNDKIGPTGHGERRWIAGHALIPYVIRFENDPRRATAPAQLVEISDTLAEELDETTLEFTEVVVGGRPIPLRPDGAAFVGTIDPPGDAAPIRVEARLDKPTRRVLVRVYGQGAGQGQDQYADFLPPNTTAPEGEGYVSFTIRPKQDIPADVTIRNTARITFDPHETPDNFLDTPTISNAIDADPPTSRVTALAPSSPTRFLVTWETEDAGSGPRDVDVTVYVSRAGGPLEPWINQSTEGSAIFEGQPGTSYGFMAQARDHAGNLEPLKATLEASTTVAPEDSSGTDPTCTITGTPGNDVLRGTNRADVICGEDGDDLLIGRGANDVLIGGNGQDRLIGGGGADDLSGGPGNDRLYGNGGADTLLGDEGDDRLVGGGGADRLSGGPGNDQLYGNNGADMLEGDTGNDQLFGGRGNDHLDGGTERDRCVGAHGVDALVACETQAS